MEPKSEEEGIVLVNERSIRDATLVSYLDNQRKVTHLVKLFVVVRCYLSCLFNLINIIRLNPL